MCEGLMTPPATAPVPVTKPVSYGYGGYGAPSTTSYGGIASAAAPGPSMDMGMASELAPETAPMGMGAPVIPRVGLPLPVTVCCNQISENVEFNSLI